jgi:hypothetical protein
LREGRDGKDEKDKKDAEHGNETAGRGKALWREKVLSCHSSGKRLFSLAGAASAGTEFLGEGSGALG